MEYNVNYRYEEDNTGSIISNSLIRKPTEINWTYENQTYLLESKLEFGTERSEDGEIKVVVINQKYDFINIAYLSDEYLIILYSNDIKLNTIFPPPNNLVMYNLKKEIIRVIPPPKPINWDKTSPIYSIGDVKKIDGKKHIAVYIDTDNYFSKEKGVIGFVEIRWLNLETFDYHPTENTLIKDYGR